MNNKALEYKTLYDDVVEMIKDLSKMDIDVSKYRELVCDVDNELKDYINGKNMEEVEELLNVNLNVGLEFTYDGYIKKLLKIKESLKKYDFCYRIENLVSSVDMDIDKVEINVLVKKCKECLDLMNEAKILDYNVIKKLNDKLYTTVYMVIKKEILVKGDSLLLRYVDVNSVMSSILSDIIKRDIKDNKLDKVDTIKSKCKEIKGMGLDSTYVNLELISMIILEENRDNVTKEKYDYLNELYSKVNENNQKINSSVPCSLNDWLVSKNKNLLNLLKKIRHYSRSIVLRIISIILSFSAIFVLVRMPFRFCKSFKFKTTKSVYTEDGILEEPVDSYEDKLDSEIVIDVKDCEPYKKNIFGSEDERYSRDVSVYTFDSGDASIRDSYFDMDLTSDKYADLVTEDTEMKSKLLKNDCYNDTLREVVIREQDWDDSVYFRDEDDVGLLLVSEFLEFFIFGWLELAGLTLECEWNHIGVINNILRIRDALYLDIMSMAEYKEKVDKLRTLLDKFVCLIKDNEDIKNKFNLCYKDFNDKIGTNKEIDNLYKKINDIDYSDVKKNIDAGYKLVKKKI